VINVTSTATAYARGAVLDLIPRRPQSNGGAPGHLDTWTNGQHRRQDRRPSATTLTGLGMAGGIVTAA